MNVTEYLEYLVALGISEEDLPAVQPLLQKRIWDELSPGDGARAARRGRSRSCKKEDDRFHMEGGSWTNNISWVRGYDNVLGPMEQASALFHEVVLAAGPPDADDRATATRCSTCSRRRPAATATGARGVWTDYGRELCRRATAILKHDF